MTKRQESERERVRRIGITQREAVKDWIAKFERTWQRQPSVREVVWQFEGIIDEPVVLKAFEHERGDGAFPPRKPKP